MRRMGLPHALLERGGPACACLHWRVGGGALSRGIVSLWNRHDPWTCSAVVCKEKKGRDIFDSRAGRAAWTVSQSLADTEAIFEGGRDRASGGACVNMHMPCSCG